MTRSPTDLEQMELMDETAHADFPPPASYEGINKRLQSKGAAPSVLSISRKRTGLREVRDSRKSIRVRVGHRAKVDIDSSITRNGSRNVPVPHILRGQVPVSFRPSMCFPLTPFFNHDGLRFVRGTDGTCDLPAGQQYRCRVCSLRRTRNGKHCFCRGRQGERIR